MRRVVQRGGLRRLHQGSALRIRDGSSVPLVYRLLMGWTRFLLFGDLGQQLDIQDHDARISRIAASSRHRAQEQKARIAALERDVIALEAGVAVLVGLLRAKGLATDEEIRRALEDATSRVEENVAAKEQARQEEVATATKERAARKLDEVRRRRRT
jgi:hypothetical protein